MTTPNTTRQQLTLFVQEHSETIEKIRKEFNPIQFQLIAAHVTLCREDEIEPIERIIDNLKSLRLKTPLIIRFGSAKRFEGGKGVLLPAKPSHLDFDKLRRKVLKGAIDSPRQHDPHITLMHPRNSTCTDSILEQICKYELPTEIGFSKISLIEQHNGGPWVIKDEFQIFP